MSSPPHRIRLLVAILVTIAVALVLPAVAAAAELEVSPVVVELGPGQRTALLTVRNASASPVRLQARASSWTNGVDGRMQLAPTRELAIFPPLLELAPGETRNLRVGTDAPAGPAERAWRLTVEELPREDAAADGMRVRVLTRLGLPVFLAPAAPASPRGELQVLERAKGKIRVALRNTGNVHLRPVAATLALLSGRGEPVFEQKLETWYLLPREERIYEVEPPAGACDRAAEMVATVQLESGAIVGRAPGACRGP